jgi:hypothetical protein
MLLLSDIVPGYSVFLNVMKKYATYGAWLSTISLLAWMVGFNWRIRQKEMRIDSPTNILITVLVSFAILVGFVITVDPGYLVGEIYKVRQINLFQTVSGLAAYFFTLSTILAVILLAHFVYKRSIPGIAPVLNQEPRVRQTKVGSFAMIGMYAYFATYLLIFLVAGERGQIIQLLAGGALAIAATSRPVRLLEFILIIAVGAMFITILGDIRSGAEASLDTVFGDAGLWQLTATLAKSSLTLYQGLEIIHARSDYFLGQLWLSQLLGVIPFLQGIFLSLSDFSAYELSSASLITHDILGANPNTAFGTSFVIDIYMNFGPVGVIAFSLFYGALCKLMSNWLNGRSGYLRFYAALSFGSLVFYASRSSFLVQMQPILWGLVLIRLFSPIKKLR